MKIFVILLLASSALAKKTFFGDQVVTVYPRNDQHVQLLQQLDENDGLLDFWSPQYSNEIRVAQPVDIRFPKVHLDRLKRMMDYNRIEYEVKIDNLQELIDNQMQRPPNPKGIFGGYDYDVYHTYDEIVGWAQSMEQDYPSLAKYDVLGQTYEGRDIPMLVISTDSSNPIVLVDCGIHAREWISPAFCQCFVHELLSGYGTDSTLTGQMNRLTFVVLPVVNADGYDYTWTSERMWRKTRSHFGTLCIGADPNRNFDALWSGPGSSANSCSDTFYGVGMESEPCVKALSNYVRSHSSSIKAYITFHSYGQMILYPYSYQSAAAATAATLDKYAHEAGDAILSVSNTLYRDIGQGATTIYLAAGGSDDFSYDQGVPLSYTIELPDNGRYGFLLPADQINGVCLETMAAMKVFADAALDMV